MRTVSLTVQTEYVAGAGVVAGAEGTSSTTVRVEFIDWAGLSKYATTRNAKGEHPTVTVLTTDKLVPETEDTYEFEIPANAMDEEGLMSITFTGYEVVDGNETTTVTNTATAKLRVLPSDYITADDGSVTPTIAEQLQAEIDEIKDDIIIATHAQEYAEAAAASASDASGSAKLSESWAIGDAGTREGEDTNNSKYFSEVSEGYSQDSQDYAVNARSWARGDTETREGEETNNSKYFSEVSSGYADDSADSATLAESWAVGGTGTRAGEDTNNAEYWCHQAEGAVAGVASFNGRTGAVVPADDDYSIDQIAATGTVGQVATLDAQGKLGMANIPVPDIEDLSNVNVSALEDGQILKYDSNADEWVNANESGGGSGGHTILDEAGSSLTQRTNLQFDDAHVTDDSGNDTTNVEMIKVVTKTQLDNLGANTDGLYRTSDESGSYLTANNMQYRTGVSTKQVVDRIEGNFANEENGATASQPYVVGEHIMRNDVMYRVKAAISQGDSFTVGTNIETKPVGDELTEINSNLANRLLSNNSAFTSLNISVPQSGSYTTPIDAIYILATSRGGGFFLDSALTKLLFACNSNEHTSVPIYLKGGTTIYAYSMGIHYVTAYYEV